MSVQGTHVGSVSFWLGTSEGQCFFNSNKRHGNQIQLAYGGLGIRVSLSMEKLNHWNKELSNLWDFDAFSNLWIIYLHVTNTSIECVSKRYIKPNWKRENDTVGITPWYQTERSWIWFLLAGLTIEWDYNVQLVIL